MMDKTLEQDDNRTYALIKEFDFSFKAIGNCQDIFKQRGNLHFGLSPWQQREAAALMQGEKLMKGCGREEGFFIE